MSENSQGLSELSRTEVNIEKASQMEKLFLHKAAQDCYKENAFPNSQSQAIYELALLRAMEAVEKKETNPGLYCIRPDVVQLVIKLLKRTLTIKYIFFITRFLYQKKIMNST